MRKNRRKKNWFSVDIGVAVLFTARFFRHFYYSLGKISQLFSEMLERVLLLLLTMMMTGTSMVYRKHFFSERTWEFRTEELAGFRVVVVVCFFHVLCWITLIAQIYSVSVLCIQNGEELVLRTWFSKCSQRSMAPIKVHTTYRSL